MIPAKDAHALAQVPPTPPVTPLSDADEVQAEFLDAAVEAGITRTYTGGMFDMKLPAEEFSPEAIAELRRRWEAADRKPEDRWTVGVFPRTDAAGTIIEVQVVFAPQVVPAAPAQVPPPVAVHPPLIEARPLSGIDARITVTQRPRLLVRMPTRGRPRQALDVLARYRGLAGMALQLEVVIDRDDATMHDSMVLHALRQLDCVVTVGDHKSKIEAVNGGRITDWDILLLASDDMVPVLDGYAARACAALEQHFPLLDGAVYFDDGYQHANCCTLPIIGRRLYDRWGYVYHPAYASLFSDQEQTELWRAQRRLVYIPEVIIEHCHPAWGKAPTDALYQRNDALWNADQAVYEARKVLKRPHAQFGFDTPPLWLSIGIATLPTRRDKLLSLVDELYYQIGRGYAGEVEVLIDDRAPPITVGEKRQALLERTCGHFVVYVDDDDGIAHDYVSRIVSTIRANPTADCLSMRGWMTSAGHAPKRWEISLAHPEWIEQDGVYLRSPSHLSPVRRELAAQVGFPPLAHGEDYDYSRWLRPLLKTEAATGDAPLYYYFFDPRKGAAQ